MKPLVFIDIEVNPDKGKILDLAALYPNGKIFHEAAVQAFNKFIQDADFICGHNILKHDIPYLEKTLGIGVLQHKQTIDTLLLSPLLFPTKPYHALVKDDKLQTEELNNPLHDAQKACDLFFDELNAFEKLPSAMQGIYYGLLHNTPAFSGFFNYLEWKTPTISLQASIEKHFSNALCSNAPLAELIRTKPIELAYALALLHAFVNNEGVYSVTPPWVLKTYPAVEQVLLLLRNKACISGCSYCNRAMDIHLGLKKYFGYDTYRSYHGESLQENAVQAAMQQKSLLAVFPTGGGKSITFQVPALMSGENTGGLTIVISPLQSLMKDQVDNLERLGLTQAVTINGMLDPIERAQAFARVEDGSAVLLYISPEALRSKSIERLLLNRKIIRFVIDEAHCFSAWGQDFRVDYLYIGDFIRQLQEKKGLEEAIPVSCFTATAKQKVIEDIIDYFKQKLSLNLQVFQTKTARTNLFYTVLEKTNDEEKYQALRNLIESHHCPTIIYVSRTRRAYQLAERLCNDGFLAKPYHGKMEAKEKTENQNAFIAGEIPIMVATSAFGMGVDKKDVGLVIHFDISDSLENYIQEAGRAGRDEHIQAKCFVLFNEEDLSKHFILLNQTKISIKEIQQIWRAIKDITRFRNKVSQSALEIARKAGWDDQVAEIETRVTTAIAALEEAGYLKRGQNTPRLFANSILSKNAAEAIEKINASERFDEAEKVSAIRIIKKLLSGKHKSKLNEESGETRVDYLCDHLGLEREVVIRLIHLLREEKILADATDLSAFIKRTDQINRSLHQVHQFAKLEHLLLKQVNEEEQVLHLKELNEEAERSGCEQASTSNLKTILNFWQIKHWVKVRRHMGSNHHVSVVALFNRETLQTKWEKRQELARFIINYLFSLVTQVDESPENKKEEVRVEFSIHELKEAFQQQVGLFNTHISISDIEDALFYLSKIEALHIEGGFMVLYNSLSIQRLQENNKIQYKVDDYQKLQQYYENKVQQIHIVGEYAKRMIDDYKDALQFVDDYFQLNYTSFLSKYFKGSRQNEIKRNITPAKFKQLFGELSPTQLAIINNRTSKHLVVAAGPGSGKTKVLVHKLASLLLMEDVKHEQLLMITFSRAAANEFKKRLIQLIGNAALYIEIKTFHGYCFDLLGKVGTLEKSGDILSAAVKKINQHEVEPNRITKTVLVIDEAQDMNADEYALVQALMAHNDEMRVIAVGDDDQNIYGFRGASSLYLENLIKQYGAQQHELVENFRSKRNLVEWSNAWVSQIQHRLKITPGMAHQNDLGNIEVHRYSSKHLIHPLLQAVLHADLKGTVAILTRTNEEALQISGQLTRHRLPCKLLQSNDGFSLFDMVELQFFLEKIDWQQESPLLDEEKWEQAKQIVKQTYQRGQAAEVVWQIITEFERVQPKRKYKSDFSFFIRESKLEDFLFARGETILVSTMHKAKGREFDEVFLLLEDHPPQSDDAFRLLYVAMTRAKKSLRVFSNYPLMGQIQIEQASFYVHPEVFTPLNELLLQLTHKDIWLDYFQGCQSTIDTLHSGDSLIISGTELFTEDGRSVLRFSKQFLHTLNEYQRRGYGLKRAYVNFVLNWKKEEVETPFKIVLPALWLEK